MKMGSNAKSGRRVARWMCRSSRDDAERVAVRGLRIRRVNVLLAPTLVMPQASSLAFTSLYESMRICITGKWIGCLVALLLALLLLLSVGHHPFTRNGLGLVRASGVSNARLEAQPLLEQEPGIVSMLLNRRTNGEQWVGAIRATSTAPSSPMQHWYSLGLLSGQLLRKSALHQSADTANVASLGDLVNVHVPHVKTLGIP